MEKSVYQGTVRSSAGTLKRCGSEQLHIFDTKAKKTESGWSY